MSLFRKTKFRNPERKSFLKWRIKLFPTLYGRILLIIATLSVFLFVIFGLLFRSVNEKYMTKVIHEKGNVIGTLVEGALYRSMLDNDKAALQGTLDVINKVSGGIDEVNMYDSQDDLVYSSFSPDDGGHSDPNCKSCHSNLSSMFPRDVKASRIIELESGCSMIRNDSQSRHLMIKSPILNRKSCYESSCHAHQASDKVLGSLIIKIPLDDLDSALRESTTDFFLLASTISILLIAILFIFTQQQIKRPLNAMFRASQAVSKGDLDTRLTTSRGQPDDVRSLAEAFNGMLDSLQAANNELENWSQQLEYKVQKKSEELSEVQNELINIERIASLGKLSLSVAHEINNPLSGILIYTKLVYKQINNQEMEQPKKDTLLRHLRLIETETKRCGDIVKGLLDFSKKDQDDFEEAGLHEILMKTYDLMLHPMKIANISFLTDLTAQSDTIYCNINQIKQACIALLVNASEAITEHGEIILRTINPDEHHIKIEIIDNGIGIPAEVIPHIFEPFFSTKHNASGIGLGLPIVHGIIQSHQGKIEVKSESGTGTTFSIVLPLRKQIVSSKETEDLV